MIKGAVGKKEYKEPFSKGIMARSLYITDLGHDEAYEIASCIENKLLEENISEISPPINGVGSSTTKSGIFMSSSSS